jgi:hypothetical protein
MPAAAVHKAFLQLVGKPSGQRWCDRAQFFAALAVEVIEEEELGGFKPCA